MQAENGDDDDDVRVRITAGVFTGSNEDYLKERRRTLQDEKSSGLGPCFNRFAGEFFFIRVLMFIASGNTLSLFCFSVDSCSSIFPFLIFLSVEILGFEEVRLAPTPLTSTSNLGFYDSPRISTVLHHLD